VWLDADVEIRQLSKGKRSLDDFCRLFFGGQGGSPKVAPYTMQDVLALLQDVQPNDWAGFFRKRVDSIAERAPIEGIHGAGWRIVYSDRRSDYWSAEEDQNKTVDLSLSIGLTVNNDGYVNDVAVASPAQKAGIAPGARITSVGGRQFTVAVLREAVQSAVRNNDPIEIVVKNGEYFSTHKVDDHGGERYPHLERDGSKLDLLDAVIKPRVGR
jgi:predicted metalloprotease with PDZ domain